MSIPTYSETQENLPALLEETEREGAIRIRRQDGRIYLLQPETAGRSPLDVQGVDLDLTLEEIHSFIREGRKRAG